MSSEDEKSTENLLATKYHEYKDVDVLQATAYRYPNLQEEVELVRTHAQKR